MADWAHDLMNLDLNLGHVAPTSPAIGLETEPSLVESVDGDSWGLPLHMNARNVRRARQQLRWRQVRLALEDRSLRLAMEAHVNSSDPGLGIGVEGENGSGTSQVGEGSVAPEERNCEVLKTCDNNVSLLRGCSVEENEDVEKTSTEKVSFFDCNICLDLSREPVVTCCGHLFCWSCIYRWLHIHSDAKECPVCKGEVTIKNITPIYGRGTHTHDPEEDPGIKIPARPSGRRVESLRQTIRGTGLVFPMEEMLRRLGAWYELTQDFLQLPAVETEAESNSRDANLNVIRTARALRREQQSSVGPSDDTILNRVTSLHREQTSSIPSQVVGLTPDRTLMVPRAAPPLTYRRGQSSRIVSGVRSADRFLEAWLSRPPSVRTQEIPTSSLDDRDSFSSIAAVDTAIESDSLVSLSTSSYTRRRDTSRSSDMDSGDTRSLRRRLN